MSILNLIRRPTSTDAPNAEREKLLTRYRAILENDDAAGTELVEAQTIHAALGLPRTIEQDAIDIRAAHRLADQLKGADKRRAALDKSEANYRAQVRATQEAIESARAELDAARQSFQAAYDVLIQDHIAADQSARLGGEVVGPVCERLKLSRTSLDLDSLPRDPMAVFEEIEHPCHMSEVDQSLATSLGIINSPALGVGH
jgi:hypothetical protein